MAYQKAKSPITIADKTLVVHDIRDISLQVSQFNIGTVSFRVNMLSDDAMQHVDTVGDIEDLRIFGVHADVIDVSVYIGNVNPTILHADTNVKSAIRSYGLCNVWVQYRFRFDPKEEPVDYGYGE